MRKMMRCNNRIKNMVVFMMLLLFVVCAVWAAATSNIVKAAPVWKDRKGWNSTIVDTSVAFNGDEATYTFDQEKYTGNASDRGMSKECIMSTYGHDVSMPFTIYTKMHWGLNSANQPAPDFYSISLGRNNTDYRSIGSEGVAPFNDFVVFSWGLGITDGKINKLFDDKNHRGEYNAITFDIGETNTKVSINDSLTFYSDVANRSMFTDGRVYVGFGILYKCDVPMVYKFSVKDIDKIENSSGSTQVIKFNSTENAFFTIDSRGDALTIQDVNAKTLVLGTDYSFSNNKLTLYATYLKNLSSGMHEFKIGNTRSSKKISVFVNVLKTETTNGGWKYESSDPGTVVINNDIVRTKNSTAFRGSNSTVNNFNVGKSMTFSVKTLDEVDKYSKHDYININIINDVDNQLTLKFLNSGNMVNVDYVFNKNGHQVSLDKNNFLQLNGLFNTKHKVSIKKDSEGFWNIFINDIMSVPLAEASVMNLATATISVEYKFSNSVDFSFDGFSNDLFEQTISNGWKTINNSNYETFELGANTYTIDDPRMRDTKGETFSRERIYSDKGYDISKPIIIACEADWLASGRTTTFGINIVPNKYDFKIKDASVDPIYTFVIGGPFGGQFIRETSSGITKHYRDKSTYTSQVVNEAILNYYCIEIGENETKITINNSEIFMFTMKKSDFKSSDGIAYINVGVNKSIKDKVNLISLKSVNTFRTGIVVDYSYSSLSKGNIDVFLQYATQEELVVKLFDEVTLLKEDYIYDPIKNILTIKEQTIEKNLTGKSFGEYKISISSNLDPDKKALVVLRYQKKIVDQSEIFENEDKLVTGANSCSSMTHGMSPIFCVILLFSLVLMVKKYKKSKGE